MDRGGTEPEPGTVAAGNRILSPVVRAALELCALSGCTAGGVLTSTGSSSPVMQVTKIDVSLSTYPLQTTPAGLALGFQPEVTTVTVGTGVQFVNVDNTSHTATSIPDLTSFPAKSPFSASALNASVNPMLSASWSSGTLQPGSASEVIIVDKPGTYLYGCFFHYSGEMRGIIVAQ